MKSELTLTRGGGSVFNGDVDYVLSLRLSRARAEAVADHIGQNVLDELDTDGPLSRKIAALAIIARWLESDTATDDR